MSWKENSSDTSLMKNLLEIIIRNNLSDPSLLEAYNEVYKAYGNLHGINGFLQKSIEQRKEIVRKLTKDKEKWSEDSEILQKEYEELKRDATAALAESKEAISVKERLVKMLEEMELSEAKENQYHNEQE